MVPKYKYLYSPGIKPKTNEFSILKRFKNNKNSIQTEDNNKSHKMTIDVIDVISNMKYNIHYSYLIPESLDLLHILHECKLKNV